MNFSALSVSVLISCYGFSCLTRGELQDDMNPVSTKKGDSETFQCNSCAKGNDCGTKQLITGVSG